MGFLYTNRYVLASVKDLIIDDLNITDAESSLPATGMVLVFMVFAVIFGSLSDREYFDRRIVLFFGIIFWSLATFLAGLATDLEGLVLLRSLVGVGEAAYGTIVPPMLSDFYPVKDRNLVYGFYFTAIPVGGALGYGIGAVVGQAISWQAAFFVCGIPGFILAWMVLTVNDPVRGLNDEETVEGGISGPKTLSLKDTIRDISIIMGNKHFLCCLIGVTSNNFALGGLADWFATFMTRYTSADISTAGLYAGASTIIGGIFGTIIGAKVARQFETHVKSSFYLIPALFTIPGAFFLCLAINLNVSPFECFVLLAIGSVFVWTFLAPLSAVSINVIPPEQRALSCGLVIFFQHALGDVISPPIIGAISDSSSLRNGLQLTWIFVLFSGVIWLMGWYFLPPLAVGVDEGKNDENRYFMDIFRAERKPGSMANTRGETENVELVSEQRQLENLDSKNPLQVVDRSLTRSRTPSL